MASSSSAAAARSSQIPRWEHDVFLSFRGSDTRRSFTSHLYEALINREIITFLDDKKLEHGATISQELLKAIEQSRVALIIFSRDYASSSWCLDELVKVMECKDGRGQTVIPVFCDVDPSTIRYQTGNFAEAFAKHEARCKDDVSGWWRSTLTAAENLGARVMSCKSKTFAKHESRCKDDISGMQKVQRWRIALTAAANLRGYDTRQGTESEIIKQIVNQISSTLCKSISGKNLQLLDKLKTKLSALQSVLNDEQITQPFNPNPPQWLNGLWSAVDRAENLMEEVSYEVLRIKVEGKHQHLAETSNQHICDLYSCLSDEFFLNIKKRLEQAVDSLEELQKQIGDLGLTKKSLDSCKQESRSPSTSVVDDSDIFGRKHEIKYLFDRVMCVDANGKNLSIIPIVGMGGIGKTTLAKAVYNDNLVKGHFDLNAWFCVSEPYDALAITKGLLQEIGSYDSKDDNNLNQLQIKLKGSLKGKRFLIVLDDVWNDNYDEWDNLRNLFVQGDIGSKIIVTTRKESVALMMGSVEIKVGILSSEASWALFRRHSLENRNLEVNPELEEVGRRISDKCKGLPLALKTLAGMLRSKSEVEDWRAIFKSETWELPSHRSGILPALMLSYNDLPAHLKQCFAYCAVFPKDYPISKDRVIQLWMANGLVQRLHLGNQCFLELISRSFFERIPKSSHENMEKFSMHDLVNDLAQIASSKRCLRLEDNEGSHVLERSRHVSYSMGCGEFEKLKPLYKLEQLKTLLPVSIHTLHHYFLSKRVLYNILPRLTSLRALSLSGYDIEELPNELFIKLKLLRFLDLSNTWISMLPDSIFELYHLETLLLSSCKSLKEFPPQMEKLINLRHLDISNTALLKKSLPLTKLKSIHVLLGVNVFLGGCSGSGIEDLGELHNLYGSLSILQLQNVVDRKEALKAKLREKEHVKKLSLEWSGDTTESSQIDRYILDELQPNKNIKELRIKGYRGTQFPNWLADHLFLKLVKLSLSNCKDCFSLPALGQLPSLKFLTIRDMDRITEVTEEFYGDSLTKKPFNSLEKLEFVRMPEWKEWHLLGNGEFPTLQELFIKYCPKLTGKLPENLCSLTNIEILKCPAFILETRIHLPSLKTMEVDGCDSLTSLPLSPPSTLKEIKIRRCGKLKLEFFASEMMSRGCNMFLESLELSSCDSIDDISEELVPRARNLRVASFHSLRRLLIPMGTKDLKINTCVNLEILSVPWGTQTTLLYSLDIWGCKKLKSLPEHMQELLPSLKELKLQDCPEIESFPEGGLPFHLQVLSIWNCKKLVNGRKEWHLKRLSCLRELDISHDGSDEEIVGDKNWQLLSSIRRFYVNNLKTLSSQVLKSLTSLEYLEIHKLPQIQSLLEEGLPPSLSELTLWGHNELHSLPAEGIRSLALLQRLRIIECKQLQSIPESALPSSLCLLDINTCRNLQSLPEKGMPSSISILRIIDCPLLKPLIEFEKGEYWPKLAHIPTIEVGDGFFPEYQ